MTTRNRNFLLIGLVLHSFSIACSSKTVLDKYLKHAVSLAENFKATDTKSIAKQCQMHFHLSHYADALYRSYDERLNSNEWQAAMRLRKLKVRRY